MANVLEIIIKSINASGPGLQAAQADISGFAGQVAQSVKGIGMLMATESLARMGDAVQRFGKQVIDAAREYTIQVEEFARATGVSAEEASRLIQVADDQRVSITELQTAVRTYSRQMAEAGIATQFNTEEIARLSDEYVKLAPGTERNAYLLEKFGRSGLSMARLMEQGGEAIRSLSESVNDNLIISQENIDTQRRFEMAMDNVDDALMGVKLRLADALTPSLERLATVLVDDVIPRLEKLVDWFLDLPEPVQNATFAVGGLTIALSKIGGAMTPFMLLMNTLKGGGGAAAGGAAAAGGIKALASKLILPAMVVVGAIVQKKMLELFTSSGAAAGMALGDALGVTLSPEMEKLRELIIMKGPFNKEAWTTAFNIIGGEFNKLIKSFGEGFDQSSQEMGSSFDDLDRKMALVFEDGSGLLADFVTSLGVGEDASQNFAQALWLVFAPSSDLPLLFEDGSGAILNLATSMGLAEEPMQNFLSRLWEIISPMSDLPFLFEDGSGKLQNFLMMLGVGDEQAQSFGASLFLWIHQPMQMIRDQITLLVNDLQGLGGAFINMGKTIVKAFGDAVKKVIEYLKALWRSITDVARNMARSVQDWFRAVGDAIVRGIWAGIQGGWNWLVEQVKALAHSLLDAAMNALQSGSPARVFIPVGESIPEGIAEGIQRRWPKLLHDFSSMLGDFTFPANSGFAFARAGGGGGGINIDVRRIELHGSLSASERAWMKRNQRDVAEKVLLEALSRG